MITIPISIGELIDKLSILRVKQIMISNQNKLEFVNKEFELLYNFSSMYLDDEQISNIYHELVDTNSILWKIEDKLRIKEKNKINELSNSEIREQKDYVKY
jgi:hypothetical protein